MNTKRLLCLLALFAQAVVGSAEEPGARTTGRVLLLDNERILEGDIVRRGDQFCIRRAIGETWVPGNPSMCLCADLPEAFSVLRQRANLRDPDERLRLARWCLMRGLKPQALEEARAAVELRPGHVEGRRLLQSLERAAAADTRPAEPAAPAPAAAVPSDYNPESLSLFTTKVQPILMNTCCGCHGSNRGGSFHLARAFDAGLLNRRATQQNLAAVLAQVNRQDPLASPLLLKAVTVHGPEAEAPPIKNRQAPAYRTLEAWVKLAVGAVPAGRPATAAVETKPSAESPGVSLPPTSAFAATTVERPAPVRPAPRPEPTEPKPQPPVRSPPPAATPAAPVDPFDPAIFNQQMRSGKQ